MSPADSPVSEDTGSVFEGAGHEPSQPNRRRLASLWAAPVAVLFGLWLWAAFAAGAYLPREWLPVSLVLGLFGLVVAVLLAYPRRPRQLSLAVLSAFALYAVWVAASALWAGSPTRVWLEAARTFSFLLAFALALVFLTDPGARKAIRYLLMAAALALISLCVWRLWSADQSSVSLLFGENRFYYPVNYPNNAAALFLVAFWPLMWLAAGGERNPLLRGAALGLATGLLGLAVMTQSRGAIYSLALTLILTFLVSPGRLRTLFYLIAPALLMVYAFPHLNRYWTEGPELVGGAVGGRTVVMVTVAAAFMGLIASLLERWVMVSRRMKVVFGAVILVAVLAGGVYGLVTLTRDAGGPLSWVSQTWQQFVSDETPDDASSPGSGAGSHFDTISSSGRVDLWRVGWEALRSSPALGVGADNWVFEYDRLRHRALTKAQQVHSLELQALGETGIVGGVFAFGGMALAIGGLLWPRSAAGWRRARESWLRRRRAAPTTPAPGANMRFCNPRWGNDPTAYGWEMALLMGVTYWIIHASVDWLWQMAGVTIPMLLLLAAGVSAVDARADIIWPRWNRWLRVGEHAGAGEARGIADADGETGAGGTALGGETAIEGKTTPASASAIAEEATAGGAASGGAASCGAATTERATLAPANTYTAAGPIELETMLPIRRAEKHFSKQARRRRREERRQTNALRLQPPGILSHVFRYLLLLLALVVLISAGLPYLSLKTQDSARGLAQTDGVRAAARAQAALWFQPGDPGPFVTQAGIYSSAASEAAASEAPDRAGAVLDNLALSINSYQKAIANEPADWALHYRAGVETLNLWLATQTAMGELPTLSKPPALGEPPALDYTALVTLIPGLRDWSALSGSPQPLPAPGAATDSLAQTMKTGRIAEDFRQMSPDELRRHAVAHLLTAKERNPLASQVTEALKIVEQ